jgi:hypothetical protein
MRQAAVTAASSRTVDGFHPGCRNSRHRQQGFTQVGLGYVVSDVAPACQVGGGADTSERGSKLVEVGAVVPPAGLDRLAV